MATLFGLIGTESLASHRFKSVRRKVFYDYPNGKAPLTGLTSLMAEESCSDPEFYWYEKRLAQQLSQTATNTTFGPFAVAAGTTAGATVTFNPAATTEYIIKVDSSDQFRKGHVIRGTFTLSGGVNTAIVQFLVTEDPRTTTSTVADGLKVRPMVAATAVLNGAAENLDVIVTVIGSAHAQGQVGSSQAPWNEPVSPYNYCQIFRTSFAFTSTELQVPLKFDETGVYKDRAKEASVNHMIEMEKAWFWGQRTKQTDLTNGLPIYSTGGFESFLLLWEAGSTYGNTAATADTDDNKRIITNSAGYLNEKLYDGYLERVFRITNDKANEKLVLCGSGALSVVNQMYKSKSVLQDNLPLDSTYGMDVVKHRTPFGSIYYKTHPLFNQDATLRYSMWIIDVGNLHYRYLNGRDTNLYKDRQENDADYRKDEWLTEAGLEVRFPESHMYIKNVLDYRA